jgi:hypothetical protein
LQLANCQCEPVTFRVALECRVNSDSKTAARTAAVTMDQNAYVPVDDMSSEEYDFMAAVFEALHADALDAGAMDLDMADHVVAQQSWVADMHDPDRTLISMAPPKRFYRRNWQSFSLLLLNRSLLLPNRCTQTATSSKSDTPNQQLA